MASKEFPLSLVIRAVDKATAPLRAINERIAKFTAPVRKLNNSFRAFADEAGLPRLVKGFRGVGSAARNVASEAAGLGVRLAGMAAGAGFALYSVVRGAVDAGDELGMMAERVGLSVDAYAQLRYAAAQADVEQEQFNSAMDKFNRNLGDAKAGGGALLAFLQKVSPALAAQMVAAKGTDEALGLMTKAFERVTDPGKRAALASAAFGKGAAQMGVFLGQGSKAIEEQRARYLELAGSQADFAKGADGLDMAMRDTEMAFGGLRNAAAAELFPALTELAKALAGVLAGNRGELKVWAKETGAALSEWVKGGGLARLVAGLKDLAGSAKTVVGAMGGLKGVAVAVGLVMGGGLLSSVVGLVQAFVALAPAIGSVGALLGSALVPALPFLAAALGLAAAGTAIYKEWDNLKTLFTDFTLKGGLLDTLWQMLKDVQNLMPHNVLGNAGAWWGKTLGITGAPTGAATGAAAAAASGAQVPTEVNVTFANVPKGVRVDQDPGTAPVNLDLGYSMELP